jgi:hypothetical protein
MISNAILKIKTNIQYLGKVEDIQILELGYLSNCIVILYDPIIANFVYASPSKMKIYDVWKTNNIYQRNLHGLILIDGNNGLFINSKSVDVLWLAISRLKNNSTLAINLGNNAQIHISMTGLYET